MKILSVALAVVGLSLAHAAPLSAMPMQAPQATMSTLVVKVAGGCGEGWHRGPNGGCLRNYAHPAMHACPRGYHIGPGGHCRANGY